MSACRRPHPHPQGHHGRQSLPTQPRGAGGVRYNFNKTSLPFMRTIIFLTGFSDKGQLLLPGRRVRGFEPGQPDEPGGQTGPAQGHQLPRGQLRCPHPTSRLPEDETGLAHVHISHGERLLRTQLLPIARKQLWSVIILHSSTLQCSICPSLRLREYLSVGRVGQIRDRTRTAHPSQPAQRLDRADRRSAFQAEESAVLGSTWRQKART